MPLDPSYQCPLLGEQQGYRAKAQGKSLQTYAPIARALLTLDEKELERKRRKFEICYVLEERGWPSEVPFLSIRFESCHGKGMLIAL